MVQDYSLASLVYFSTSTIKEIRLAALRLIVLLFKDDGLNIYLLLRLNAFENAQDVKEAAKRICHEDLDLPKYQAKRTTEQIEKIILNSRENIPEDIKLLITISKGISKEN